MIECHHKTLLNLILTIEQGIFFTIECHCKPVLNSMSIIEQKIYCQMLMCLMFFSNEASNLQLMNHSESFNKSSPKTINSIATCNTQNT